jgi:Uncharacterized protein conserved in bacteria (DUF2255)
VTTWTADDLQCIAGSTELDIAPARDGGTPGPATPIWVVRVGDDLYVRSYRGPAVGTGAPSPSAPAASRLVESSAAPGRQDPPAALSVRNDGERDPTDGIRAASPQQHRPTKNPIRAGLRPP